MRKLIAVLCYSCLLLGCDLGGNTIVHRENDSGIDIIHSKVKIDARLAHFECIASRSGECHYSVFRKVCPQAAGAIAPANALASAATNSDDRTPDCAARIIERFVVKAGTTRAAIDMKPGFTVCVTPEDTPVLADCKPPAS
jgi:hypothetical protein